MAEETTFEVVINKLVAIGFYEFFVPFLIMSVILYALLRKTKVLGDSNVLNGIVALSIGMLILGFPVLAGISFASELSTFFVQSTIWIMILVLAVIIAGVFYPDIWKMAEDQFKNRHFLFIMLAVAIGIFVTSGLVGVFVNVGNPALTGQEPETPGPPADIVIIVGALIIFMVLLVIAAAIFRSGGGH